MDTIEQIEKDYWRTLPVERVEVVSDLQLRILIQIAKELRVLAQRSE